MDAAFDWHWYAILQIIIQNNGHIESSCLIDLDNKIFFVDFHNLPSW